MRRRCCEDLFQIVIQDCIVSIIEDGEIIATGRPMTVEWEDGDVVLTLYGEHIYKLKKKSFIGNYDTLFYRLSGAIKNCQCCEDGEGNEDDNTGLVIIEETSEYIIERDGNIAVFTQKVFSQNWNFSLEELGWQTVAVLESTGLTSRSSFLVNEPRFSHPEGGVVVDFSFAPARGRLYCLKIN